MSRKYNCEAQFLETVPCCLAPQRESEKLARQLEVLFGASKKNAAEKNIK